MRMFFKKLGLLIIVFLELTLLHIPKAYGATSPELGEAASFSILSSTYTNTVGGTTINGDLGYTTGPATAPTVNGTIYSPPSSKYTNAGIDQASALAALNAQLPCDYSFPIGDIDLASDVTNPNGVGNFTPGIYCIDGAADIGGGGTITLTGTGTYIFRITGALTTSAGSTVVLEGGASACDIFWTPGGATTLGANSAFIGTNFDDSGITIGSTVSWLGRALSFAETVSTDVTTITTPTCSIATTSTSSDSSDSSDSSSSDTSSCPVLNFSTPSIIESRRIDPDSIFISWGPYSGTDSFNVRYGLINGEWLYNTNVTGFTTTLNDLPSNYPIIVQVAARNSCAIGDYGEAILVGEPSLPSAGLDPHKNSITQYFWDRLSVLISFLLKT